MPTRFVDAGQFSGPGAWYGTRGRENPTMKITQDTKVAEMLEARPDLRWTLVANGIEGLAEESHFPPPQRTLGEAAQRHGADATKLLAALKRAAAAPPDVAFLAAVKQKYANFKGGCCGGHDHGHHH